MIKIFRKTNFCRSTLARFNTSFQVSKSSKNQPAKQNQDYVKSREPVIRLNAKKGNQMIVPVTVTNDQTTMKKLLIANICFVAALTIWPAMNIGIGMLNAGFIMGQLGQQLKKFLIVINNSHYQQLRNYKPLTFYNKMMINNTTILAGQAGLLVIQYYQSAHLLTILWYAYSVYNNHIPFSFYPIAFPVLLAILINLFQKPIKELIEENKKKMSVQTKS